MSVSFGAHPAEVLIRGSSEKVAEFLNSKKALLTDADFLNLPPIGSRAPGEEKECSVDILSHVFDATEFTADKFEAATTAVQEWIRHKLCLKIQKSTGVDRKPLLTIMKNPPADLRKTGFKAATAPQQTKKGKTVFEVGPGDKDKEWSPGPDDVEEYSGDSSSDDEEEKQMKDTVNEALKALSDPATQSTFIVDQARKLDEITGKLSGLGASKAYQARKVPAARLTTLRRKLRDDVVMTERIQIEEDGIIGRLKTAKDIAQADVTRIQGLPENEDQKKALATAQDALNIITTSLEEYKTGEERMNIRDAKSDFMTGMIIADNRVIGEKQPQIVQAAKAPTITKKDIERVLHAGNFEKAEKEAIRSAMTMWPADTCSEPFRILKDASEGKVLDANTLIVLEQLKHGMFMKDGSWWGRMSLDDARELTSSTKVSTIVKDILKFFSLEIEKKFDSLKIEESEFTSHYDKLQTYIDRLEPLDLGDESKYLDNITTLTDIFTENASIIEILQELSKSAIPSHTKERCLQATRGFAYLLGHSMQVLVSHFVKTGLKEALKGKTP